IAAGAFAPSIPHNFASPCSSRLALKRIARKWIFFEVRAGDTSFLGNRNPQASYTSSRLSRSPHLLISHSRAAEIHNFLYVILAQRGSTSYRLESYGLPLRESDERWGEITLSSCL